MADYPNNVGWIGLGIMGLPMVRNLLAQMPNNTQFHVFDVVQDSVDAFVADGNGRAHACRSSKEVADKSVCNRTVLFISLQTTKAHQSNPTGNHNLHGPRR